MANDVFFNTKSWYIGSFHTSLSFSSDGTTIAGTMAVNGPDYPNGKVNFWETATGAITSSFNNWSFVVFSPADPDMGAVVGLNRIQMVKRKSPGGKTWRPQGESVIINSAVMCVFRPDGKRITVGTSNGYTFQYNPVTTKNYRDFSAFSVTGFAYCLIEPNLRIVARDAKYRKLRIESYAGMGGRIESYTGKGGPKVHCQLTPEPVKVYFCAWSEDGKWIATYDEHCDVCLWDASDTTSVPLERLLPRDRSGPASLFFVLDSTALMIHCGGYLSVWDIA
ncbi:hypothetical protein BYT27DRAFT_7260669 [Phlegmacium glaucopus]|nr:hypothetical protein BYT27DRAFT_7260669 [Phlegmacium glaucopus]